MFLGRLLLLSFTGALIALASCSRGRLVIPAHPVQPNYKPVSPSSVVFQMGNELISLNENVYYSGNIEIFATNPIHDSVWIDLALDLRSGDTLFSQGGTVKYSEQGDPSEFDEITATVIYSGDSISGTFSGVGDSIMDGVTYAKISGTFSNVPVRQ